LRCWIGASPSFLCGRRERGCLKRRYLADAEQLPLDRAFTVTVGKKASRALFYLNDHKHVGDALAALAAKV